MRDCPAAVQLAEPRIAVPVGMPLDVLVPQDLQRDVLALQLAVNRRPVGLGATAVALLLAGPGEELRFQRRVGQLGGQRPTQPGRRRAASASAARSTAPRQPGGRSRCRTPRRHSTEARRAPGASRSSLLASSPPAAKAKGADPKRASRGASNRATSSRNGGRNHLGMASDIKSEWWARSSRNPGRLQSESARSQPDRRHHR